MDTMTPTTKHIEYLNTHPDTLNLFDEVYGHGAGSRYLHQDPSKMDVKTPTQEHIDHLKANPQTSEMFDEVYGDTASTQYLTTTPEATPEGVLGYVKDIAKGVLSGPQVAVSETIDALESFDIAASKKLDEWGVPSRFQITDQEGNFDPDLKFFHESEGDRDLLGGEVTVKGDAAELDLTPKPVSMIGKGAEGVTQFVAGMMGAGKFTKLKGVAGMYVNGALSDAVVFDPDKTNLSALMGEHDLAIPLLTEALSTDPDDPEWTNRMRNAVEGAALGGLTDLTFKGLRAIARKIKGESIGGEAGEQMVKEATEEMDAASREAQAALDEGVHPQSKPTPEPEAKPVDDVEVKTTVAPLVDPEKLKAAVALRKSVTPDDIAEGGWFNASKMDGPQDAQNVIKVIGDALDESGASAKMGFDKPETLRSTMAGATKYLRDMVDVGTEGFEKRIAELAKTGQDQAKVIVAGKMALQTVGGEISKVADQLEMGFAAGKTDAGLDIKLLDLMETHANLQAHLKSAQTSAARATSAGRLRVTDGLSISALERVQKMGGSEQIRKLARDMREAKGPAQQAKLVRRAMRTKTMDVVNEYYINSLLSGYKTHLVNITSNAINVALLPAERIMGGLWQGARGQGFGQAREGVAQYMAIRSVAMDSLRLAGRSFVSDAPILDNAVKLEYGRRAGQAITSQTFKVSPNSAQGKLLDGLGSVLRVPARFLQAEDEFFKQLMFRSRLQAELSVKSANMSAADVTALGYKSKGEFIQNEFDKAFNTMQDLADEWKVMVDTGRVADDAALQENFIKEHLGGYRGGNKTAEDALRVAREATFTTPLANGTMSNSYQQMANRHPVLRQITPFIQTPVNILNKAFDRTPLLNIWRQRYRERLRSPDPAIRAEAAGEMATAVSVTTALLMLSHEGRITGGGPVDAKKKAIWMQDKNWQPYSLNIGSEDKPQWVEYKRLDPHAFLFGIIGDISEMQQASEMDPSLDTSGMFALVASAIGNNLTSKTWLQGIAETVEVLNSKDRPWVVQRWAENKTASFVPFSAASRQGNQAMDENMKEARGFVDKIKQNTWGMSAELPDRHDWVTGKPVETPSHLLGYIKTREGDGDEVSQELRKLSYGFSGPDRKIGGVKLSSEMYQDWARLMGSVKVSGRTLHQTLEREMGKKRYDLGRDKVPDGLTSPAESHRVGALAPVISDYKAKSREALFDEYPHLEDAWEAYEKFNSRAQAGKSTPQERENLILKF